MSLTQLIYTSTCTREMTPRVSHEVASHSVTLRQELNLTGRVFANDIQAFGIIEGHADVVEKYYAGVAAGPLVANIVRHMNRPIEKRDFTDYSVWLNSREQYDYGPDVRHLTAHNLDEALPKDLSAKIRIMVEVHLKPDLLAA